MLGIGEDGHTASIFPDQMQLLSSNKICDVAVHPLVGKKELLTGSTINNSDKVIFY
jgi:6-phosphogluconolactonase